MVESSPLTTSVQDAWKATAYAQGLLCMICCKPPHFEDRSRFYDTGVCESCEQEMSADSRASAA